ncbi:hypothetical protein ACFOHS_12745 [Jhaorihella thermophila]
MQTGTKISGIAHLLLIGWAVFGGSFDTEPLPFEVHDVSVISAEEFAAMTARPATPDVAAEPEAPAPPEAPVESPDLAAATEAVPAQDAPDLSTPPEIEAAPPSLRPRSRCRTSRRMTRRPSRFSPNRMWRC